MAEWDVIVAGAGPAGSVAARTAAERGCKVLLIDKSEFPRNKPCGGGITTRAFARFPWLRPIVDACDPAWFSRLELEGPHHSVFHYASAKPAVVTVRRQVFDAALLSHAQEAGVTFTGGDALSAVEQDATAVHVVTASGRRLTARWLIGADGVNGIVSRRAGLSSGWKPESLALDMMEETPLPSLRAVAPDVLWFRFAAEGNHGYSYIFPKSDCVNVGVGYLRSWLATQPAVHPYERQASLVRELKTAGRLQGESSRDCFTPYHIPVGGPLKRTARGRVLLVGDAGGFVHGVTAEGIFYAMVTGELAGLAVARGGDAADVYERSWRREIGPELRDSQILQRYLFTNSENVARIVRGSQLMPWVAETAIAYVLGDRSYRQARRSMLLRFPKTAFRLLKASVSRRWFRYSVSTPERSDGDGGRN